MVFNNTVVNNGHRLADVRVGIKVVGFAMGSPSRVGDANVATGTVYRIF